MLGAGDAQEDVPGFNERPTTAAAVSSRPTSSWGFSSRVKAPDFDQAPLVVQPNSGKLGTANMGMDRPHTATGIPAARPTPGGGGGGQIDPRTGKQGSYDQQETDGDGQVVASARALMRYRRTRTATNDGSVEKSWTSGNPGEAAPGAPR